MLAPVASSLSRSRGLEPSLAGTSSATIFSGGQEMILLQSPSRLLLQTLQNRLLSGEKGLDLDCQSVEFDDVRYHIQFLLKSPMVMVLSVSLPAPPPEVVFVSGLPFGAVEAIKAAYGAMVHILDPPKDGYNLTMKLNLAKLPADEGSTSFFLKILLQSPSRFILQTLQNRLLSGEKGLDLDCQSVEFDDVRYHIQFLLKSPMVMVLSVSLPAPPPEVVFVSGLPFGAVEAIKAAYGAMVHILDPPKDGYNLTMKLNPAKLPADEEQRHALLVKIASVRDVVLGAPLRGVLKHLAAKTVVPDLDQLIALVHRPKESFFLIPRADKIIVVFPMRFQDSVDTVLTTSFLQEFAEARRTTALNNAPPCMWSPSPPLELKDAPAHALSANAGFVSFVISPRHVEGRKLEKTVWSLSTFHAYVRYHAKCSEGFMHTRMRRRVETMIQAVDRAKPDMQKSKKVLQGKSFKRLSLKDSRSNSSS